MIRRLAAFLARLRSDRRGNVLMILAFAMIPLTFSVGMGIDYSRAARTQTRLNAITDAAALAAVTPVMLSQTRLQAAVAAVNMWYGQVGITQCSAATVNRVIYNSCAVAGYGSSDNGTVWTGYDGTLRVTVTDDTSSGTLKRTVTISYAASSGNIFSSVLGLNAMAIGGSSTTTASPITYIDYYVLVDISQSMGIGATQADMANLFARTTSSGNGGCVFGCHVTTGGQGQSNEYLAHKVSPRINLRIDAAITAIQNIIADAQSAAGSAKNIRVGLYTMSDDPVSGTRFTVISPPSSNYSDVSNKAAAITLGNNNANGMGDTNFTAQMPLFNAQVPTNGLGLTASSPKNYVFIISDGVADTVGSGCTSGHCTSAFDPTNCTALKMKATVGTIYTTYLPIYNNNDASQGYQINYQQLVIPFAAQIAPNMQSCATNSGFYYEASDGPALDAAMKSLFASTLKAARLTQ